MSLLDEITMEALPTDQYYREAVDKQQIYLHHTAGSPSPFGSINWWKSSSERVATAFILAGYEDGKGKWTDGQIFQCFGSAYWAHHLGVKAKWLKPGSKTNTWLNKHSIGIEICNWGHLTLKADGRFYTYTDRVVEENEVVELATPYKGHKYYQRYTDAQLENTGKLVKFLCNKYDIPSGFKGMSMFNVSAEAQKGEPGVWTHTSVRADKTDCFPQIELIQMLESL